MNWELHPNLSFTVENKMGNLHKAGNISNLTQLMRCLITSNFNNLSTNWDNMFYGNLNSLEILHIQQYF